VVGRALYVIISMVTSAWRFLNVPSVANLGVKIKVVPSALISFSPNKTNVPSVGSIIIGTVLNARLKTHTFTSPVGCLRVRDLLNT